MPSSKTNSNRAARLHAIISHYRECQASFKAFVRPAWKIVEPGKELRWNWHIDAIASHLEAVARGQINRLIINVPYRSMKSTLTSVMFPVWCWINNPSLSFMTGSHSDGLATRDAVKSRTLINDPWFQAAWGSRVKLTGDQNQKTQYETTARGVRIVFGMRSSITGHGGDVLIIDDAHDAKKAMYSDAERAAVIDSYDNGWSTRLNDPEGANASSIIIIGQRVHLADLPGHLLEDKDRWVHLRIPFQFEPEEPCETVLGWRDPRTKPGEFYWPERFGEQFYEEAKKRLGSYGIACQLQQRPMPLGGGLVKMNWFRRYKSLPPRGEWIECIQVWDTASKGDELLNCPWVCGTWVRTEQGYFLAHVHRDWHDYPAGKVAVLRLIRQWRPDTVVFEDASTGQSLIQELPTMLSTLGDCPQPAVVGRHPEHDKVTRFGVETPVIEEGRVWLPEDAEWLPDYERELGNFPRTEYKDQADMTSLALNFMRTRVDVEDIISWI